MKVVSRVAMCVTVKARVALREPKPGACPPQGWGHTGCLLCPCTLQRSRHPGAVQPVLVAWLLG